MTLQDNPTKPAEPVATPPTPEPKKQSKLDRAKELARKYSDLPYAAARNRIMEEIPCAKSVAHKAVKLVEVEKKKGKHAEGTPDLKIIAEPDQTPAFLEPQVQPTPEIEAAAPPAEVITPEAKEELDLFRDMLRGLYSMIFSKDGVLGEKYGRSVKQCEQLADQQFRWLMRRYSIEQLQSFDTILLVGAYATVIGGIAKDYIAERRKAPKAEKRAP